MRTQVYSSFVNGVMTITFDDSETQNGLDWEGFNQLAEIYENINSRTDIKVVVHTGANGYFYTGGRVNAKNPGEKEKYSAAIGRLVAARDKMTVPGVAAVSGYCCQDAMSIVEKSDFAIALDTAKFCYPEVRMGGAPMMVMAETYGNLPKKKALEAYLSSWDFSAYDAERFGLVNCVASKDDFDSVVKRYVDIFLNTPQSIVDMTLRAFRGMGKLNTFEERAEFAMNMLRNEVLEKMAQD